MPKRNLFVLLMMIAVAAVAWLARDRAGHGRRFAEVLGAIERSYLEPVDQQRLFNAAMEGVFSTLDEHSAFITGDRRDHLESLLDQEFGGVGLELIQAEAPRGIVVVSPVYGGPAWHAGIAAGERIVAIDGEAAQQMTIDEALRRLRGRSGTPVRLSLAAAGDERGLEGAAPIRDVVLVREMVTTESVLGDRRRADGSWEWLIEGEPAAALVRITSFGERTAGELTRALETVASRRAAAGDGGDEPAKGMLVLDLRGNVGGLLSAAVEVCDIFLDEGVIVSTRGRATSEQGGESAPLDVRRATRGAACADLPVAVLVDGLTASAAEVVAACLQDHGRAVVVGSRSFGKGTVQTLLPLSDGTGLVKLTTSEYLRPSRENIHRRGDDDGDDAWGVSPDRGCEIMPSGRQIETWQAWRRLRDVVPVKGGQAVEPSASPSHAMLPRHVDPVLAKALDAVRARE